MKTKNIIIGAIAVVALLGAGAFAWASNAKGDKANYDIAVGYLRHAAEAGVPEAIWDMHSIEPNNPKWTGMIQ